PVGGGAGPVTGRRRDPPAAERSRDDPGHRASPLMPATVRDRLRPERPLRSGDSRKRRDYVSYTEYNESKTPSLKRTEDRFYRPVIAMVWRCAGFIPGR